MNKKLVSIFVSMLLCVTIFSVTGTKIANENNVSSFEFTPSIMMPEDAQYNQEFIFKGKTFYAWCITFGYEPPLPRGPIKFQSDDPGGAVSIKSTLGWAWAGTWANNEWYAIYYNLEVNSLITIDVETGVRTTIGNTGIPHATTGLIYDPSTKTMYASAVQEVSFIYFYSHFYTIDLNTGVATYLGVVDNFHAISNIACDSNGNIYGIDILDDSLYLIDPNIPSLKLIGSTGIPLNNAQGAEYDKDDDILYLAAFSTERSGLYTCDTTSGRVTLIGMFPEDIEVAALAIPTYNTPPETPEAPTGPTQGVTGVEYAFTTRTTDPEGGQVYYMWNWGDGITSNWLGPYNSGAMALASHTWNEAKNYNITVKAKDINGSESNWSCPEAIYIVDALNLEISNITGGFFKINAVIKNTGGVNANDVNWSIALDGGIILRGKETIGNIASIPAGNKKTVGSDLILGLGRTVITISAECTESSAIREQDAFVLIFIIL